MILLKFGFKFLIIILFNATLARIFLESFKFYVRNGVIT